MIAQASLVTVNIVLQVVRAFVDFPEWVRRPAPTDVQPQDREAPFHIRLALPTERALPTHR